MGARVATALVLALLAFACGGGARIPAPRLAGWHAVQAGSTRLVGNLAADELRTLAGELARFDAIFAGLVGWRAAADPPPLSVFLLRDRELALRFGLGRGIAGWTFGSLDESFIAVQITSDRDEDRNTLFHEYTHVLLGRNRRAPLPRWYHEGLASYFSTLNERDGAVVVGAAPAMLAARVAGRGALPLERVFTGSLAEMRFDEVSDFYATSWALSHYLLSSPARRRELAAFVRELERGVPSDEAQRAAFGRSTERLGQELAVHVGHLARGVPGETVLDASAFAAPEAPPAVALAPHEVAQALGTLALRLVESGGVEDWEQGPGLARGLLAQAAPAGSGDARAEAALGEARAVSGDTEGGLAAVQAALARAPDDPRVRLHAGRVALLHAEAQEAASGAPSPALAVAEEQYRSALAQAPESASAWFGLGRTLVRRGRAGEAFAAFETARRFGWSAPLDVALARLCLERGERERAVALLRPIAQDPHAGPSQQEAALLLGQAIP